MRGCRRRRDGRGLRRAWCRPGCEPCGAGSRCRGRGRREARRRHARAAPTRRRRWCELWIRAQCSFQGSCRANFHRLRQRCAVREVRIVGGEALEIVFAFEGLGRGLQRVEIRAATGSSRHSERERASRAEFAEDTVLVGLGDCRVTSVESGLGTVLASKMRIEGGSVRLSARWRFSGGMGACKRKAGDLGQGMDPGVGAA